MQFVSIGDKLHEMSKPIFLGKNEKNISLLSAEFVKRVIKVKVNGYIW